LYETTAISDSRGTRPPLPSTSHGKDVADVASRSPYAQPGACSFGRTTHANRFKRPGGRPMSCFPGPGGRPMSCFPAARPRPAAKAGTFDASRPGAAIPRRIG
jgi:hypothetical protein